MGKVIVGTTMSLDGFINDRDGSVGSLYPDLKELRKSEMLQESIQDTGAVVMGRRAYDMAQGDFTDYEYQTPIFVLTHDVPEKAAKGENERLSFTFANANIESVIEQAKTAAGDKNVTIIGGAETARQVIRARLADELQIGIMPVILGTGLRFFEDLGEPLQLEKIRVLETQERTDILFRVIR